MPAADADLRVESPPPQTSTQLPFPPITPEHILNCSVHSWHPRYRTLTPKTRLVPLPPDFVSYLRADGILLPPDDGEEAEPDDEDARDPSADWPNTHAAVKETIKELGGRVHPKLNWSAPKDACWMAATNTMECASANEVYLLLKSSDFVSHDLEQAFDGCTRYGPLPQIPYHLVLRKTIPAPLVSMEFRCFVRNKKLLGISQRDINYYDFMGSLVPLLKDLVEDFFEEKLRVTFPDDNYTFDVYIPQPKELGRVWLIDINPWAPRTDPLLFSWLELLTMAEPESSDEPGEGQGLEEGVVRLQIQNAEIRNGVLCTEEEEDVEDISSRPEFRIVNRGDPEAFGFNTQPYSAHKLPKDVVDAGIDGTAGMRDFMERWRKYENDVANGTLEDSDDD